MSFSDIVGFSATSVLLSTTDVDRTFYDISNVPIGDIGP